jgi:hypothetical protein
MSLSGFLLSAPRPFRVHFSRQHLAARGTLWPLLRSRTPRFTLGSDALGWVRFPSWHVLSFCVLSRPALAPSAEVIGQPLRRARSSGVNNDPAHGRSRRRRPSIAVFTVCDASTAPGNHGSLRSHCSICGLEIDRNRCVARGRRRDSGVARCVQSLCSGYEPLNAG